jgi:SHS family lactate transporter-like MFS transporter
MTDATKGNDAMTEPIRSVDGDETHPLGWGKYLLTRIPTLVPPMNPAPNPFKALTLLNRQQWLFFLVRCDGLYCHIPTNHV